MEELNSKLPRGVDLPMPVGSDEAKIFSGPERLEDREQWRQQLHDWKKSAIQRFHYDDSRYRDPELASVSSFNVALIWLWDELLFDFKSQKFTPEKLVEDSKKFGGLDGVILWHAYPVIGIDSRNQFDYYNQVPDLAQVIKDLQNFGIKVYLNYNPWDRWTKRPENSDQIELAHLIKQYGFDGVFLDTMKSADPEFMRPIFDVNPKIIVAGESRVQQERICDHVMSWAQWFGDSEIPGVIRAKWFEQRHMLHQTRRWNRSHIDEIHTAWLNGAGMLLWEVVFGSWVGWNERETRMWRESVAVLRKYVTLTSTGEWEPLTQLNHAAERHGLFASKFSLGNQTLYTIVNKNQNSFSGEIVKGVFTKVPGNGVAAIVEDVSGIRELPMDYDACDSNFPNILPARLSPTQGLPTQIEIQYRNRECGLYHGAPFIDAWKPLPPNYHQIFAKSFTPEIRLGNLDASEITNAEFHRFIEETHYQPRVKNRFLQHWVDGSPLESQLDLPVTFIDLEDAQAFAKWRGCHIPTEWEWQTYFEDKKPTSSPIWNLTDSVHSDGRTRFLMLKGGSTYCVRNGQGAKSTSGIAESDWYVDGGVKPRQWIEKLLLMGHGMSRSENISFTCFNV